MVLSALLAASAGGCKKSPEGADAFWVWFAKNAEAFAQREDRVALVEELNARAKAIDPKLTLEVGFGEAPLRLVVSGDGIRDNIPHVRAFAATAPAIPGWKVVAFRQRMDLGLQIQMGELTLSADTILFKSKISGRHVDVILYPPGYVPEQKNAFMGATFIMLDAVLGELDVMERIGSVELKALPKDPEAAGLKKLKILRDIVDAEK